MSDTGVSEAESHERLSGRVSGCQIMEIFFIRWLIETQTSQQSSSGTNPLSGQHNNWPTDQQPDTINLILLSRTGYQYRFPNSIRIQFDFIPIHLNAFHLLA